MKTRLLALSYPDDVILAKLTEFERQQDADLHEKDALMSYLFCLGQ